ncbi:ABC transporter permease [Candidatus Saccharibacteria bacterium]|jgi:putative ABC transport system permease protein|nr:ABC transporter permease [Candidatus Saccharibacteria bacterium]
MKYRDIFARAGRSLKNSKGRTILTSLAIAVGAFTITLSLAAGEGARQYAQKLIQSNVDPQSIFIAKDPSIFGSAISGGLKEYSPGATQYSGATFKSLNAKDLALVRGTKGVVAVTPTYIVPVQYLQFQGNSKKYTTDVTAYDPSIRAETAAGSLPKLGTQIATDGVVVPESYANQLKITPKKMIGTTITLHVVKSANQPSQAELQTILQTEGIGGLSRRFAGESKDISLKVVAVSAKSSTALSASNGLFLSEAKAKELSDYITKGTDNYQHYITATVKVASGYKTETVKNSFKAVYNAHHNKEYIVAKTAQDLQGLLFTIVNTLQGVVAGFGVIALIASLFGIINTQYISVLERTREIGLMKALGMRGRHVSRLFQFEAAWIGLLGGIIGAVVAWLVGSALNPLITKQLSLGDGNYLLIFQMLPIAALIMALVVVAMLAGWFPARKAAKLDPIEALRTE